MVPPESRLGSRLGSGADGWAPFVAGVARRWTSEGSCPASCIGLPGLVERRIGDDLEDDLEPLLLLPVAGAAGPGVGGVMTGGAGGLGGFGVRSSSALSAWVAAGAGSWAGGVVRSSCPPRAGGGVA